MRTSFTYKECFKIWIFFLLATILILPLTLNIQPIIEIAIQKFKLQTDYAKEWGWAISVLLHYAVFNIALLNSLNKNYGKKRLSIRIRNSEEKLTGSIAFSLITAFLIRLTFINALFILINIKIPFISLYTIPALNAGGAYFVLPFIINTNWSKYRLLMVHK